MTHDSAHVQDCAQGEVVEKTKYKCAVCGFVTREWEIFKKHGCKKS